MPSEEREESRLLTPATADLLGAAELEVIGRLANSSNGTFLVRCQAPGEAEGSGMLAVYKPAAGERPLWDFPADSLHRREVAAFELSRWLGWDLVPTTVERPDGPLGAGSVQAFVDHDPDEHYFTLQDAHRPFFMRLAFFDMLANNADRKGGHCLLDGSGRVWAIDHGLTFHVEPKLRTVLWDYAGSRLPAAERRAAHRLAGALDEASDIRARLSELISGEELRALRERASALSQPGIYPAPGSAWSFPWPVV
ncbi:MAG: hypothetical protein QOK05_2911 [Chloroflexota bacterium]|nr:hypothetical protein [Chloroflexota bacterium]